jgi:hypothetical protein
VVLIGSDQATEKENQMMAETVSMALAELLRKADAEPDLGTLREGVRAMTQARMELEVAQHLSAELPAHVGAAGRTQSLSPVGYRNYLRPVEFLAGAVGSLGAL